MLQKTPIKLLTLTIFCLLFGIGQNFAQPGTGQITGVVTDSTGAVVPNATVTLTNQGTNQTQTATTSDDGIYRFIALQPGNYTVKTAAANFAEKSLTVEVQVGRTTDANVALGAGDVSAQVEVTAEGVQTTISNFDAVQDQTAIENLPINGRRFQDFVTLTPGAQVGQANDTRGQVSLSGQRGINSNINVDGVDYNQPFFGGIRGGERSNLAFTIPQESIKEFQVVAAGYSAEFGRSSGGIVNAVTKSGDNQLRGSLFYLYRPERFARGNKYTDALQAQKLAAAGVDATLAPTQHQFGGSIGGPIIKDKLFYFASYEQQRFRAPRQIIFNLPSGFSSTSAGFSTDPTIAAAEQSVLSFYNGQQSPYQLSNDAYAGIGRIDWVVNDANRLNIRYNASKNKALNSVARGETSVDPTTNQSISTNGTEGDKNNIGVAQLVSNISSTSINELRLQYAREDRPRQSNSELPQISNGFGVFGATAFLPTTEYDTRAQIADSFTYLKGNHTFKFGGEYSRLFANQTFGQGQFGQYTASTTAPTTAAAAVSILDNLVNVSRPINATSIYLGRFDTTGYTYLKQIGNLAATIKVQELAFFAQDAWRITPKFTLNYGLRIEEQYNPTPEANNTSAVSAVQNTIFPVLGRGFDPTQIPDSGLQVGPRLGFAYDPKGDGKTVIRGFSGVYYARTPLIGLASSVNNFRTPPGDVRTTLAFTGFTQANFNTFLGTPAGDAYKSITGCVTPGAADTFSRCVPNTVFRQFAIVGINLNNSPLNNLPILSTGQISSIASALGLTPNPLVGAQVIGQEEDFKNPRSVQFGFGVEHELSRGLVIGLDYSQVNTSRLQRNREINIPTPLTGEQYIAFLQANNTVANYNTMVSTGIIDQIRQSGRIYIASSTPGGFVNPTTGAAISFPGGSVTTRQRPTQAQGNLALGSVQLRESSAKSLYRALTFRVRLVRKWGQLNTYYTLSKNLSDDDNERDSGGVGYENTYDLSREYYLSRIDRRHQFTANPVFFLPYGFEVSSAIRLRSGTPINTTVGADLNGDGINNDRPLLVPGLAFKRNVFRNRDIYDVDARVQKRFKFAETKSLVFSAEFFNLFNQANLQFQSPSSATSSGALAQYCSTPSQLCGLNGIQNVNFLQVRDQNPASVNFGQINSGNVSSGSPVFQVQFGARFQF